MARGKDAAKAANRRLTEAQDQVAALEQQLSERAAAHRAQVHALTVERDKAQSALSREVDARTGAVVRESQEGATRLVAAARQDCEQRIRNGIGWLVGALGDQMPRDLEGCARAFGIQVADIIATVDHGDGTFNRHSRRTSNKGIRAKNSMWRELSQAGPDDAVQLKDGPVIMPEPNPAATRNRPLLKQSPLPP